MVLGGNQRARKYFKQHGWDGMGADKIEQKVEWLCTHLYCWKLHCMKYLNSTVTRSHILEECNTKKSDDAYRLSMPQLLQSDSEYSLLCLWIPLLAKSLRLSFTSSLFMLGHEAVSCFKSS